MATLRGRPGRAGRPKSSPVVIPFSPLTASPLATRSPLAVSAKRGLLRALEAAEEEPAILVTGPTCAEGTNAKATQDVPKMANPEMADESFIVSVFLYGSGKGLSSAGLGGYSSLPVRLAWFVPFKCCLWLADLELQVLSTSVGNPELEPAAPKSPIFQGHKLTHDEEKK